MAIKRSREAYQADLESSIAMANYLLMLSDRTGMGLSMGSEAQPTSTGRVFECKTCNRQFQSFQALGGHRASHKKPRPGAGPDAELTMMINHEDNQATQNGGGKPKTHECSICGLEFSIGQALGGHMRRHRAALTGSQAQHIPEAHVVASPNKANIIKGDDHFDKRVKCLDLNLTPLENGLMEFGTIAPIFC